MMRYFPTVWPRKNIDGSIPASAEARATIRRVRATILPCGRGSHLADRRSRAGAATLADDEASHLTRVLRLGVGADVDVFDGRGGMYRARVDVAARTRGRGAACWSPRCAGAGTRDSA